MYLFETMRAEGGDIHLWPQHLARLMRSARALGWRIEPPPRPDVRADEVIRLQVGPEGETHITRRAVPAMGGLYRVGLSPVRVDSTDARLYHKSSERAPYDAAAAWASEQGLDDALLLNEADRLTEATIANVIVEKAGQWFTPPVSEGLLPGVMRGVLVEAGRLLEKPLHVSDLYEADVLYLCNAVRGVFPVTLTTSV